MNIGITKISLLVLAIVLFSLTPVKISFANDLVSGNVNSDLPDSILTESEDLGLPDSEVILITEKNNTEIFADTDPLFLMEKENVTSNFYHLMEDLDSKIDRYKILLSSKTLFSRFQRTLLRQSIRSSIREAGLYLNISKERSYLEEKNIIYFENKLLSMSDLVAS